MKKTRFCRFCVSGCAFNRAFDCIANRVAIHIALLFFGLFGVGIMLDTTLATNAKSPSIAQKGIAIEAIPIKEGSLSKNESFIGSVRFKEVSSIASSGQGVVKSVFFSIGQSVKKGQKLLSLDSDLLTQDIAIKHAKIADARYTLERQKNELERYKNLLQSQSISIQQYENLEYEAKSQEARIKALEGELAISKTQIAQKTIYAPFEGIIVEQGVRVGEWVKEGQAICQILNSRDTEVIIDVSSAVVGKLSLNQKVDLSIGGKSYSGQISALIPKADSLSRTFPVHISVRNDGSFLDGMAAQARLDISGQTNGEKGFLIPRDSVVYSSGKPHIFIVQKTQNNAQNPQNMQARIVPISIITTQGSFALIKSLKQPLKENDLIVVRGQDNLKDGAQVWITNKPKISQNRMQDSTSTL
ncbi:efflux RND transporter periplasmic adaptor subunit [Helicobacter sp. T3_23-1059]